MVLLWFGFELSLVCFCECGALSKYICMYVCTCSLLPPQFQIGELRQDVHNDNWQLLLSKTAPELIHGAQRATAFYRRVARFRALCKGDFYSLI
jgi:hypothetical protein